MKIIIVLLAVALSLLSVLLLVVKNSWGRFNTETPLTIKQLIVGVVIFLTFFHLFYFSSYFVLSRTTKYWICSQGKFGLTLSTCGDYKFQYVEQEGPTDAGVELIDSSIRRWPDNVIYGISFQNWEISDGFFDQTWTLRHTQHYHQTGESRSFEWEHPLNSLIATGWFFYNLASFYSFLPIRETHMFGESVGFNMANFVSFVIALQIWLVGLALSFWVLQKLSQRAEFLTRLVNNYLFLGVVISVSFFVLYPILRFIAFYGFFLLYSQSP